jgi:putative transposase
MNDMEPIAHFAENGRTHLLEEQGAARRAGNLGAASSAPTDFYMIYNLDIHHRRSIRLREYDYSSTGAYFVTICVHGRECLFGEITDCEMKLNDAGRLVEGVWKGLPGRFPHVELDECIIMPNHFHGIIVIADNPDPVGAIHELPLHHAAISAKMHRRNMLLPKIIGYLKMNSAKGINLLRYMQGVPVWQRNYYERIIRNEAELDVARKYIAENPMKWAEDEENPVVVP